MINFREVNDTDILKDWLDFREDTISSLDSEQDMKHWIYFEEIADKILKSIPKQNRKFVEKQLEQLDDNFFDYITYWNEKYYRNGFVDGSQIAMGCFEELNKGEIKSRLYYIHHPIIQIFFLNMNN